MLEPEEQAKLMEILAGIDVLENGLRRFETKIGPPIFIADQRNPRFKYPSHTSAVIQVLKAARVVSGLDAAAILLVRGHVIEMGVLFRTIDDFLSHMLFLQEADKSGKPTADQQRLIDEFFAEEDVNVDEMMKTPKQRGHVPRKKVQAAEARVLLPENPDRLKKMVHAIDSVYSMYVHGDYLSVMEMYEGGDRERFRVRGMLGTPRIPVYRRELAHYTHRALNTFVGTAAIAFNLRDVAEMLLVARHKLEAASAYQT